MVVDFHEKKLDGKNARKFYLVDSDATISRKTGIWKNDLTEKKDGKKSAQIRNSIELQSSTTNQALSVHLLSICIFVSKKIGIEH